MNNQNPLLDNIANVITNKRTRSLVFLIMTFVLILIANGLMPIISGQARYTAEIKEVTYSEYVLMKEENKLYDLTHSSRVAILKYKNDYRLQYPDLTPEEILLIEPPSEMVVSVFTKFFFQSYWWYFGTGLALVSAVSLFYAVFNYLVTRSKDRDVRYINGEDTIRQLNEKYLDPDTFEDWLTNEFNKKRKIKQHIKNTKHALKTLELKTTHAVRRRFKDYYKHKENEVSVPDTLLPVPYNPLTKAEKRYMEHKDELLEKLTESYIQDYVIETSVANFKAIQAGFVYSGIDRSDVLQDEYSSIKTDAQQIRSSMVSKILMSMSVTLAFASILTVLAVNVENQSPLWIVMNIIMKIIPLLLQIYFAIDYNNWFMENQLLPNLKYRENIAMMYLAEMKRQGKMVGNIIINKIDIKKGEL